MTPETYRLLHVVGAMVLLLGLGGILATAVGGAKPAAVFTVLHGIGLLVMLVAGIGKLHKDGLGWPNWALAKIGCWLLLGALPILVRRGLLPRLVALLLVVGVGATAAWLAQAKPF
ncbi:MAG: hypothetical protein KF830_09455 [Planctomycetes bacterium]|nr:hypothetical protein [Planctomycetota bacterium]